MKFLNGGLLLATFMMAQVALASHDFITLNNEDFSCTLSAGSAKVTATLSHWFGQSTHDSSRRNLITMDVDHAIYALMTQAFGESGFDTSGGDTLRFEDTTLPAGAAEPGFDRTEIHGLTQWLDDGGTGYNLNRSVTVLRTGPDSFDVQMTMRLVTGGGSLDLSGSCDRIAN